MEAYFDVHFFTWFSLFFSRAYNGFPGGLTPDEIQCCTFLFFSLNAAILGSFLVLSRMTMMVNAISHTMIIGIVSSFYFHQKIDPESDDLLLISPDPLLFFFSTATALITAFCTRFLSQFRYIKEDAANAIVFSSLFSIGITAISILTKNAHVSTELVMGNPDALIEADILHAAFATALSVFLFFSLYRGISAALFDPEYAKMIGLKPSWIMTLVLFLVSMALVFSFRAVGFIMGLAFFVIPPLIARCFSSSLGQMILYSILITISISFVSVAGARHLLNFYGIAVSTGAFSVVLLSVLYSVILCIVSRNAKMAVGNQVRE